MKHLLSIFSVQVNKERSDQHNIETGVGQGSILSPTLFSIFINEYRKLLALPGAMGPCSILKTHYLLPKEAWLWFRLVRNSFENFKHLEYF